MTTHEIVTVLPNDEHNQRLVNNVHPPAWMNPQPTGRYNLVVIGAGTAGLVAVAIASALGAKVASIEKHLIGGDCLNVGCVPSKAVIRASRAWAPRIPGAVEAGYLTNETLFTLTELPSRLAVIGAGPIGCEMAQAFARFGSRVCLFEMTGHILPREDTDAAEVVQEQMNKDGVCFVFHSKVQRIERRGNEKVVHYAMNGGMKELVVDEILVGIGRAPNVEGLGLETVGVEYDLK